MKNVLLINTLNEKNTGLADLLKNLVPDCNIYLMATSDSFIAKFQETTWHCEKIKPGLNLNNSFFSFVFLIKLPMILIRRFISLVILNKRHKFQALICIAENEKIIFSFLAKILGLRVVWIELPQPDCPSKSFLTNILLKLSSRKVQILTLTSFKKDALLSMGFKDSSVKNISLGIKIDAHEHQDDIFANLASNNKPRHINHFTVGVVTDLDSRGQLERLFRALHICSSIIPNLQIIIIGDGKERKHLSWLAKKTGLAKMVWFVGEQKYLTKWLDSFDIYIAVNENPSLFDLNTILKAMLVGLPVISFTNKNLEDVIVEGKNGFLVDSHNVDALSQRIIILEQDYYLRNNMAKTAEKIVRNYFNLERQTGRLRESLNN